MSKTAHFTHVETTMPANMNIEKMLVYEAGRSRSTAHVFISHPTPVEEQMLGSLLLLIELQSIDPVNQDIIHEIQKELQTAYYSSEELNAEVAFESALSKVNQKIADLVSDYANNWYERLNVVAAVVHGEHLYFAEYGRMHIFIIRNDLISDILQSTPRLDESRGALKIFSNVITGKIRAGEHMLITTASLMDYFSPEKLRRTVVEHQPHQALATLESILSDNVNQTAFAALLISSQEIRNVAPVFAEAPMVPSHPQYSAPQTSMDRLIQHEHTTQEYLSPSITANIKKSTSELLVSLSKWFNTKVLHRSPRRYQLQQDLKDYGHTYKPHKEFSEQTMSSAVSRGFASVLKWVSYLFAAVARVRIKKSAKPTPLATAPRRLSRLPSSIIVSLKRLPRRTKILLAVALIIVFIFSQSIVNLGIKKSSHTAEADYSSTVQAIEKLLVEADAAFSYSNDSAARTDIQQAKSLLDALPHKTDAQKTKVSELTVRLAALQERGRHLTRIQNPTVVADLTTVSQNSEVAGMVLIGKELFAFSPAQNKIYHVPLSTGTPELYAKEETNASFQYVTPSSGNTLLFLNSLNGLNEFTIASKALKDVAFTLQKPSANIIDIQHYQGRMYLLDIANQQIWRAIRSGTSYGTVTGWLKDSTGVQDAKSFAIDGSIYLLPSSGSVRKFTRGSEEQFALEQIDPALTSATKIFTNENAKNLYILDASTQRLIVFTKDGKFVSQFTSDQFTNLKDVAIDQGETTAYLLGGQKIFSLPLK